MEATDKNQIQQKLQRLDCGSSVTSQCKSDFRVNAATRLYYSSLGQRLARETSLIYALHTKVVQSHDRGRCDMSIPIVLAHSTFKVPPRNDCVTHWHLWRRKMWGKIFFSCLQGLQWMWEISAQKVLIIDWNKEAGLLFWLCWCWLLCSHPLTIANQQSCNSNPPSAVHSLCS